MKLARTFFNRQEQKLIVDSIHIAEKNTSSQIRVHISNFCFGNVIRCATKIFLKLKMHHLKEQNGVLIYIAVLHKKIAIIGDKAIHEKLGSTYWDQLTHKLIQEFKADNKGEGLSKIILECGLALNKHFPKKDDLNELNDAIDY